MTTDSHIAVSATRTRQIAAALVAVAVIGAASITEAAPPVAEPAPPTTPLPTTLPTPEPSTTPPPTTAPAPTTQPPSPRPTAAPTTQPHPSTTPAPAPLGQTVYPDQIAHILATIRYMESRGIYTLPPNKGNASGAYQFIESTWAEYGGYQHAYLAPPEIQDERAAADVARFLAQWNNDVSMIPVMWYYPIAAIQPELMDIVPVPSAGNTLTVREYQARWLGVFATISGQPVNPLPVGGPPIRVQGSPPEIPVRPDGRPSISFPVLGPIQLAVPDCDRAVEPDGTAARADIEGASLCTPEAPAIIFGTKLQPVLAVADGVVTEVINGSESTNPSQVTVTDPDGRSYVYSGFNDDTPGTADGGAPDHLRVTGLARLGTTVRAGQVLGFMGDTDPVPHGAGLPNGERPSRDTPHIRLAIYGLDGRALDTYGPVVDALFRQTCSLGTGPWSAPPNGEGHTPVTIESSDLHPNVDSEWIITPTGQMIASGWAALINPQDTCEYVPEEHFGPGAAGPPTTPAGWTLPIDLPTTMWVRLAIQTADVAPDLFLRRG